MDAEIKFETVALADLKPAPYNPRTITQKALRGLENSMKEFGNLQPIVWNRTTGHVISGHQRLQILKDADCKKTECVVVEMDLQRERAANITLNNRKITGEWELSGLAEVLSSINNQDVMVGLRLEDLKDDLKLDIPDDLDEVPDLDKTRRDIIHCPKCGFEWAN